MRGSVVVVFGALICLSAAQASAISEPRLIADLATATSPYAGSSPWGFVEVGSHVLFTAQAGDHSHRLFESDGTAAGTVELANGCGPLEDGGFGLLFATAELAYYSVTCNYGFETLWVSDGTAAGTIALLGNGAYQNPGPHIAAPQWVEASDGSEGGALFLQGGFNDIPLELWRTDGKVAGTVRLGVVSASERATGALQRLEGGDFVLLVEESSRSFEIWRSDGSAEGTRHVRSLEFPEQYPDLQFVEPTAQGIAFGISVWPPSRVELWYSDGTDEGTKLGAVLSSGATGDPVEFDGSIYFTAEVDGSNWLWRGDGTAETTRAIVPLGSRKANSDSFEFFDGQLYLIACAEDGDSCELLRSPLDSGLAVSVAEVCDTFSCYWYENGTWVRGLGSRIVFARKGETSTEVWSSAPDGGDSQFLATLCALDDCYAPDVEPVVLDSRLFFAPVTEGGTGRELRSTDGTPAGTVRHAGPLAGIDWYGAREEPLPLIAVPGGGVWIFGAADNLHGLELWRARPQADSGALVEDLRLDRPGLPFPETVGTVDSTLVFALIGDSYTERTLYRHTLGEEPVEPFLTVPVRRGRHGSHNAPPSLRPAGNAWFFIENDFDGTFEFACQIWRYDPVSRDLRTLFADDPQTTGIGARSDDLLPSGADYLFLGSTGIELRPAIYRLRPRSGSISKLFDLPASRATSVGQSGDRWYLIEDDQRVVAIELADRKRTVLGEFPESSIRQPVALAGGLLFLVSRDTATGEMIELRQSSGVGTRPVAEWPATIGGCPLYFDLPLKGSASPALFASQTYCPALSAELWVSDGSFERTRLLRSFPEGRLEFPRQADRLRGHLYFLATLGDGSSAPWKFSIWKSDGTPAGTEEVADLPAEGSSGSYGFLQAASGGEALYFPWADEEHGWELWRTDGTCAGTGMVSDVESGPESSFPGQLRTVGDQVIFTAHTAARGEELWQIDGGFIAAQPVADLYPGIEGSRPVMVAATDGGLFFQADDGVVGREIWELERPTVAPCVADAATLCLADGRFRARAVRRDFSGELGTAGGVALTGDSGYFWFFAPENPEILLKIVNACDLPGFENFWAYSTGLTNVEVELEIVDTVSGQRELVRTALGESYGPLFDSGSFRVCDFGGAPPMAAAGVAPQSVSSTVLPLLEGRFEARASWTKRDGTSGIANAVSLGGDSGYFWFFDAAAVEVLVKMVDACGYDGFDNFWVFAGGLTDVEVHLEVTDTWSGVVVGHDNRQGDPFPSWLETGKLRVCGQANIGSPAVRKAL